MLNETAKTLLIQIIYNRILPTKIKKKSTARADVIVKKILRSCRYFYDKLPEVGNMKYKGKRNKKNLRFLKYTDYLVDQFFNKQLLHLFGFTNLQSISNHLAAFIHPKCLISEINDI
jgi:hypothetical protein